jgi:hypothetical protein
MLFYLLNGKVVPVVPAPMLDGLYNALVEDDGI